MKRTRTRRKKAATPKGTSPPLTHGAVEMIGFDPDAAAIGDGLFGLSTPAERAAVVVIPVPFDATTSYRPGTAAGPAAVLEASKQVDLEDLEYGAIWKSGISMLPIPARIAEHSRRARRAAEVVIGAGGVSPDTRERGPARALSIVNAASRAVNEYVASEAERLLDRGAIPALLGGDHASPFGLIEALARRHAGLGILQIDAHADLRDRYEGFDWSHASIFHNVMTRLPRVARLVQVGVRDFGSRERDFVERSKGRVRSFYDQEIRERMFRGGARGSWNAICRDIVRALPPKVYISFDIDGLDPSLCPDTGTPVPGGFSFAEICHLLHAVARSGKRVVGFDLCEVAPERTGGDWNANVGARVLYKLIGCTLASRR